jgi:hypothetical protein
MLEVGLFGDLGEHACDDAIASWTLEAERVGRDDTGPLEQRAAQRHARA